MARGYAVAHFSSILKILPRSVPLTERCAGILKGTKIDASDIDQSQSTEYASLFVDSTVSKGEPLIFLEDVWRAGAAVDLFSVPESDRYGIESLVVGVGQQRLVWKGPKYKEDQQYLPDKLKNKKYFK